MENDKYMRTQRALPAALRQTPAVRAAALCSAAAVALLAGCAMVPGQHMTTPAQIPVTTTPDGTVTSQQQIAITPIDLTLIQQMRAARVAAAQGSDYSALFAKPGPYKVGPGDVLQITVWDHPELAAALGQPLQATKASDPPPGVVVASDGTISFPYISPALRVTGMSVDQIQKAVHDRLAKEFKNPEVTVRVASYRSAQVYVDGEVRTPGGQPLNDIPMTLTEAINRSGGFTANADRAHITLTRNGVSYPIDLTQLIAAGRNPQDIVLQPGDMLRVTGRDDNTAYVMGEVSKPTSAQPTTDGRLTLSEALNQAGFVNQQTADPRQLYVIRSSTDPQKPEIYHLDASSPVSMVLANQFDLKPKDVVYVDNGPLVRFNRVLSLLLPALNAGLTAAIVTK